MPLEPGGERLPVAFVGFVIPVEHARLATRLAALFQVGLARRQRAWIVGSGHGGIFTPAPGVAGSVDNAA